jgi:hypothetical protein
MHPITHLVIRRGLSSVGRALPLQGRCQGFDSPRLHNVIAGQKPGSGLLAHHPQLGGHILGTGIPGGTTTGAAPGMPQTTRGSGMSRRQPHTRTAAERGYGAAHRRERARVKRLVDLGVARCSRCGGRIAPGAKFHLDHQDHPQAHQLNLWRGPSHPWCNLRARNQRQAELARQALGRGPAPTRQGPRRAPAERFFDTSRKTP